MAESLFDIFGDHLTRQVVKNVSRQPLSNIENMGKISSAGPVKPNEPVKKSELPKKSFLSNTGKALKNTPVRNVFTPRAVNVGSMIYSDENNDKGLCGDDVQFTKPSYKYDNHHRDLFDYLPVPEPEILKQFSPPNTPPPATKKYSIDFNCSYQDEFFKDGTTGNMVRNYVRKTDRATKYTREQLLEAVELVRNGEMTAYRAAIAYKIPRPTIVARVYEKYGLKSKSLGRSSVIPEEIEKKKI